jgi:hypothetical protein
MQRPDHLPPAIIPPAKDLHTQQIGLNLTTEQAAHINHIENTFGIPYSQLFVLLLLDWTGLSPFAIRAKSVGSSVGRTKQA